MSPISPVKEKDVLYARYLYTDDFDSGSGWVWGRWILFVIFVVFILGLGLTTVRVNRRRRTMGQAPIRGTAWMTPPSYRQSQRQYNGANPATQEDYVPQYTATANDQDMGYYDERGEFHLKSEAQPAPTVVRETASDSSTSLERPGPAVTRDSHLSDIDEQDFRRYRPTTAPPTESPTGGHENTTNGPSNGPVEMQSMAPPEKAKGRNSQA